MFQPKIEKMTRKEIETLQKKRLLNMIKYAYKNVPLYKHKFKEANITPDSIKKPSDMHKIPFTVKDDLRDHYPYGIMAVPLKKIIEFHASSGTTGIPTVVSYTQRDLNRWSELMARTYACAGCKPDDIVQNAYGYGLFTGGLGFHYGAERLGCAVLPTATGNTKRQLKMMVDLKTTVLASTPSYAIYLMEGAKEEKIDLRKDTKVRIGMFGAEPWSEEMRRTIQDEWGIKAQDVYGMSELYGPGVAAECQYQDGLHIWSDEFYTETIDPDTGEVLAPGEKGEMVVTMLTREAMPLLRYRTKDLCVINWEKCQCGRSHPRIMRIKGRSDDMLIIGGVNVFPSQIEDVLLKVPGIGDQYQIIVDRDLLDKLAIKVEVSPEFKGDRKKLLEEASETLTATLTVRANIELLDPGTLPRSEGKAKRVIDLRKQ